LSTCAGFGGNRASFGSRPFQLEALLLLKGARCELAQRFPWGCVPRDNTGTSKGRMLPVLARTVLSERIVNRLCNIDLCLV
jgi:hypothetical protein